MGHELERVVLDLVKHKAVTVDDILRGLYSLCEESERYLIR